MAAYAAAAEIIDNHTKTGGEKQVIEKRVVAASIDDACGEHYTAFKIRRKHKFLVFKIDLETEAIVVDVAGPKKATLADFKATLPYTDCRFAVYDHEFTTPDGRPADKLFFLSWMPHNATPYSKMAYASGKGMLRETLDGVLDTTCSQLDGIEEAFGIVAASAEDEEDPGDPDDW